MELTLLEYVQDIMSDINSDQVNSISDTQESEQVAFLVRDTYLDMVMQREWNWIKEFTRFEGLSDIDNPSKMRMPTDCTKVEWFKYNKKDVWYLEPEAFIKMANGRDATALNAQVTLDETLTILNDRDPTYWTTFDDDFVLFDSFDSAVTTTLTTTLSQAYVVRDGSWTHSDTAKPHLPRRLVPTLLAGAKSAAFLVLKQTPNPREERKYKRGMELAHTEANKAKALEAAEKTNAQVDFGRRTRGVSHRGRNNW